jgi:hypothetical protein
MPVDSQIANAAGSFRMNAELFERSLEGLSPEEWRACPNESANAFIWIAGHIVWARSRAIGFLGSSWSRPWLPLFARGAKAAEPDQYPTPEEIVLAWHDVKASLSTALEDASAEALSAPSPPGPPSFDGKLSGLISFFAIHESYHVGQAAYVRRCLGRGQVSG